MTLTPQTKKHKGAISVAIVAGVVVILGVAAFAILVNRPTESSTADTFTLRGSISIASDFSGGINYDGTKCSGSGGYSDLTPGTAVTVANQTGQVIGTGALGTSRPVMTTVPVAISGLPNSVLGACILNFAVQNVPDGLSSYVLTISHRGARVVPAAEAHDGVKLTIG